MSPIRSMPPRRARRAGLTALEMVIGLTIAALVMMNVTNILRSSTDVYQSGSLSNVLEEQAELAMERISYAVMEARLSDIQAPSAPFMTPALEFQRVIGVEDGVELVGLPEHIELVVETGQVVHTEENLLGVAERRVVWANHVPELLEDEIANDEDDNANLLRDEAGLSFDRRDGQVAINLTLRRVDTNEVVYTRTLHTRVTCRN